MQGKQRVAVTGASGFVGRALVETLLERGYGVIALGRRPEAHAFDRRVEARRFDPGDATPNPGAFDGADAVVHLAGETVAGRWTAEKKKRIASSRVAGTRALVASLTVLERRPAVLVCASASGYYGARGDEPLAENAAPGDDFLARVCVDWERAASEAEALGVRVAHLRTGIVLGDGGALAKMLAPFRLGLGGPFGGGRQFVPWIHIDDLVSLCLFALDRDEVRGPVNAVAPDYATSARFAQALGAAVRRPAVVPAPAPALRLLLGEFAETLLASQLMLPAVAEDLGFVWGYPHIEQAMFAAVARGAGRRAETRVFRSEDTVPADPDEVFAFFSDARNLATITPPEMRFEMLAVPPSMGRGTTIDYRLRVRGVPMRWTTLIAEWNPPHGFVDVQLHGPYSLWRHTHRFEPVAGGVRVHDEVEYALPFAPFGNAVAPIVERDVRSIFAYRTAAIARAFAPGTEPQPAIPSVAG